MQIFEVRRKIIDGVNGYVLPRGAFITTDEDNWVSRFGADLKKVGMAPSGVEPTLVAETKEGSSASDESEAKKAKAKEVKPSPAPQVERVKVRGRGDNKAVLKDEASNKE